MLVMCSTISAGGGGVDHTARRALHLGDGCHLNGALAGGGATAHAYEDRALGDGQQRLRNGRLRREGVNGKDGIGIGVADDRDVGGVDERFDTTAEEREAAGLLNLVRHAKGRLAQAPSMGSGSMGSSPLGVTATWGSVNSSASSTSEKSTEATMSS